MRIIAGQWRGRPLVAPEGRATRPTSDRAREGLFSMLQSRLGGFEGLAVADLFAGTGALGLEALSRGADHCLFVDSDPRAIAAIRRNVERLGAGNRAEIRAHDVGSTPPPPKPSDLVFLDPPYGGGLAEPTLERIAGGGWLAPGGLIGVESDTAELRIPSGFEIEGDRRFGKAHLLLLRLAAGGLPGA
jgi:16S rRNA (guanine966-N2)-methyltransferase